MRLYTNFVRGELQLAIDSSETTIQATAFASLLPAVASPDTVRISLDPRAIAGEPELVDVIAHTAGASTATVVRGVEGSVARSHVAGTRLVGPSTAESFTSTEISRTATPGLAAENVEDALLELRTGVAQMLIPLTSFVQAVASIQAPLYGGAVLASGSTQWPAMQFLDDEQRRAAAVISAPYGSLNVDLVWVSMTSNVGNVRWTTATTPNIWDGDTTNQAASSGAIVVGHGGIFVVNLDRLITNLSVVPDELTRLSIGRTPADASDTLAGTAAVIGVLVTRGV